MTEKQFTGVNDLVDEQQALKGYLGSLLDRAGYETTHEQISAQADASEIQNIVLEDPAQEADVVIHERSDVEGEKKRVDAVIPENYKGDPVEQQVDAVIPEWANKAFSIQIFKIAGISIAVPIHQLHNKLAWPEQIMTESGSSDMEIGTVHEGDTSITILDTAKIILPENGRTTHTQEQYKHLLLLLPLNGEGVQWGLACDEVADVIELLPEYVLWRSQRAKRTWLAAMVKSPGCALLDVKEMLRLMTD